MKKIIFIAGMVMLLTLLAGCATEQPMPMAGLADNAAPGFATLADANDPIDMAAAPVITKAALLRYAALKSLKAGRINRETATAVQACVDNVINTANRGMLEKRMAYVEAAKTLITGCEIL